jgi:hypothetical protein
MPERNRDVGHGSSQQWPLRFLSQKATPEMTDAQKRLYVSELYSGPKWKKRVERMPDHQIAGIYFDHLNEGEKPHHDEEAPEEEPHLDIQVTGRLTPRDPHHNEDQFDIY